MRIILDTNFLIGNLKWKTGIFRSFRGRNVYVLDKVVLELEKIGKGSKGKSRGKSNSMGKLKSKTSTFARLSLAQIKNRKIKILKGKKRGADDSLLDYSKKGYTIATQDIALRKRIKKAGGKVCFIRQKKYVVFS